VKTKLGQLTRGQAILYAGLLTVALLLVALYLMGGNEVFEKKAQIEYEYSSEVVLPIHNVHSLNPASSTDEDTYHIAHLVYEPLFATDETMTPYAVLAKDYAFDYDKKTVTVNLIDAKWQDGKSLSGKDVVFSINAYKAKGKKCLYRDMISGIDYAKSDDKRVVVHFLDRRDMALDMLQFPILPAHRFDSPKKATRSKSKFRPMGTGPYKVSSFSDGKLVLVPNETYHGTLAKNTLIFDPEAAHGDAYQLLQAGGIQLLVAREQDRQARITKKSVTITEFPSNTVDFLCFDCDNEFLRDKRVRQGICYAVDTQTYIELQYENGIPNDNLYFPGYLGIDSRNDPYPYSLKDAGKAFEKAGFTETGKDGYLRDKDGRVLSLSILVDKEDKDRMDAAAMLAENLEDAGVRAKVVAVSKADYRARLKAGDYDLFFGSFTYDNTMDMRVLLGDQDTNYSHYSDRGLTEKLHALRSGKTVEEMKAVYGGIREILLEEVPYYCLMYRTTGMVQAASFDGTVHPVWNNWYNNSSDWRSKYVKEDEKAAGEDTGKGE